MIKNTFRIATYSLLLGLLTLQQSCSNTNAKTSDIVDDNTALEKLFGGLKFTEGFSLASRRLFTFQRYPSKYTL